jgi:effector-binding domain-containing protein
MTQIRIVDLEPQQTAIVGEQVPVDRLTDFFDRAFSTVMAVTSRQGVMVTGPPFALYHGTPTETVDVEAGFPTASALEAEGDVRPGALAAGRAVEAMHVGPYDTLAQTYEEVVRWAREQGLQPGRDMWEEYLTDPTADSDPATWRTRVLVPVT